MANIKTPDGSFYVDDTEFEVNYEENKVSLKVSGGTGETGVASFNGRTGAVVPENGDYTAAQVGAATEQYVNEQVSAVSQIANSIGDTVNEILDGTEPLPYLHDDYTPPIATANSVGTVKPGTNLSIEADGTLNATFLQYTLPVATADNLGGVKIGAGINVEEDGTISAVNQGGLTQSEADDRYVQLTGGTFEGPVSMGDNKITATYTPSETIDLVSKGYVDGVVSVVSDEIDGILAGTTPVTVPVATDAHVGGIKVGEGLEVTEDGTLSAADIPVATISNAGTVKIGSGLMVTSDGTLSNPSATTITSLPNQFLVDIVNVQRTATTNTAEIQISTKQEDGSYSTAVQHGVLTLIGAGQGVDGVNGAGLMVASDKTKLDGIPTPTASDNGKILTVENGTYVLKTLEEIQG